MGASSYEYSSNFPRQAPLEPALIDIKGGPPPKSTPGLARLATPHQTGTAVVDFTRSSTKLVLQSCTLGCLSSVSMMKRL